MSEKFPTVAIVGRTNVGKSTLFNQMVGRRMSVVDDRPSVTRDRNYTIVKRFDAPFLLVDTGGLVGEDEQELSESVVQQTEVAIEEADLILAVFDGLNGPHPYDSVVVEKLRRLGRPVLWVINKCEKGSTEKGAAEFYELGIESYSCVSAAHNQGVRELVKLVQETLHLEPVQEEEREDLEELDPPIRVAIIGKPNVGKSTLMNRILGEERVVTSNLAGTTRDAVDVSLTRDGQEYVLVDTAGLRKKRKVESQTVERFSNLHTLRSLAGCDVAVLLLDATLGPPSEQDVKIASLIHERGRGMVIVVNKWDAVEKDHRSAKEFEKSLFEQLHFVRYAPVVFVSALTGKRCPSILKEARAVYKSFQGRIKTNELNNILGRAFTQAPPPVYRGQPVKLFFATQVSAFPPTFILFVNYPSKITDGYVRYLKRELRKALPFMGVDLKLIIRKRVSKFDREKSVANG